VVRVIMPSATQSLVAALVRRVALPLTLTSVTRRTPLVAPGLALTVIIAATCQATSLAGGSLTRRMVAATAWTTTATGRLTATTLTALTTPPF